jgi:hypothetical protein
VQASLEILTWVTFVIAMVVAPIAWFRMIRAQTRNTYWKNIAFFTFPILLVFFFADLAGLMPPHDPTTTAFLEPPPIREVIAKMPPLQLALLGGAGLIWIVGGNVLFHLHNRRLGKRWWQALNPFDPPFKDFNGREWIILGTLLVLSLGLGAAGINIGRAG